MRCGYCGTDFERGAAQTACASCPLSGGGDCGKVRCPRCGWENADEPGFIKKFREWRRKFDARRVD